MIGNFRSITPKSTETGKNPLGVKRRLKNAGRGGEWSQQETVSPRLTRVAEANVMAWNGDTRNRQLQG